MFGIEGLIPFITYIHSFCIHIRHTHTLGSIRAYYTLIVTHLHVKGIIRGWYFCFWIRRRSLSLLGEGRSLGGGLEVDKLSFDRELMFIE